MTQDAPSIHARNLAVKPAGFSSWDEFCTIYHRTIYHRTGAVNAMALAYAADLDKADKQNREVLALLEGIDNAASALEEDRLVDYAKRILRASLLPDPIDPDLLEAREMALADGIVRTRNQEEVIRNSDGKDGKVAMYLAGIKRGRELAKEQDRG